MDHHYAKAASFRAVLFRMVPKPETLYFNLNRSFRAVLFRMVPKHFRHLKMHGQCFRAVLFRMVPKPISKYQSMF